MRLNRRSTRSVAFRFGAVVFTAVYAIAALGVSLPMPSGKDLSRPFPCMHKRCGCQNAHQCWTSCCCHSVAERVAWAESHGVEAPELRELACKSHASDPPHRHQCGDASLAASCNGARTCCEPKSARQVAAVDCKSPRPVEGVTLIEAFKCRGLSDNWMGVCISLPPEVAVADLTIDSQPAVIPIVLWREHFKTPPPAPPPRGSFLS